MRAASSQPECNVIRDTFPGSCGGMSRCWCGGRVLLISVLLWSGGRAETASSSPANSPAAALPSGDELYEAGRQLFDQYAPPEIKAEFEFPSKERWDDFATRFQRALQSDSLEDLTVYLPEARGALTALRTFPGYEEYADWLEQRIDETEGAKQATATPTPTPTHPEPGSPQPPALRPGALPHYALWMSRVRGRPLPPRAAELMPRLRAAFAAEGVPPELAWLAEAESTLNPGARSPAGAKGLFQLMPETARSLGLDTFLPDERTDPEKSARAAARYLRTLHAKFGNWPLALAAYNAGEGRVSRALASRGAKDFAGVAGSLPAETRMYVPKVYALVALRTGIAPEKIPPPRAPARVSWMSPGGWRLISADLASFTSRSQV
jgi:membrane-bound lytic murein transglycosylase D